MNEIVGMQGQEARMSSRVIAEITNKKHFNVTRDIKKMLEKLDLDIFKFEGIYLDNTGREQAEYLLNKELTLTLISGYSIPLRNKIIQRWQQLEEENQRVALPRTYKEALLELVRAEEEKEQLALRTNLLIQENKQLELEKENLNIALDNLLEWVSIIKVALHNNVSERIFDWRLLKRQSIVMGYEIKKAPSARFRYQNLYHVNAFRACYPQFRYDLREEDYNKKTGIAALDAIAALPGAPRFSGESFELKG